MGKVQEIKQKVNNFFAHEGFVAPRGWNPYSNLN